MRTGLPIPLEAIIVHRDRVDAEQATARIKEALRPAGTAGMSSARGWDCATCDMAPCGLAICDPAHSY